MARLPTPGSDDNTWGIILNEFLSVEHNPDGTLKRTIDIDAAQDIIEKGQPGGYASLDGTGKVPVAQIPSMGGAVTSVNTRTGDVTGLAEQADLAAHTSNTNNPHGVTKVQVGLGNVDDTSDASKPISSLTQTALNLKANLASPTFTGTVTVPTPINNTDAATKNYVDITAGAGTPDADATTKGKLQLTGDLGGTAASPTVPGLANKVSTTRTVNGHALSADVTVTKSDVGLSNVNNTSDANKPVSVLQQSALDAKVDDNQLDPDTSLSADSDLLVATQKATKAYADTKLAASAYDDADITETNAGTSTAKYVSPDGLAGSYAGIKSVSIYAVEAGTNLSTGDGKAYIRIPTSLSGMNLVSCSAAVVTTSSSGLPTVQLARGRQSTPTSAHSFTDMLTTTITVDATEYDSKDATTAAVIDATNDDVATGDLIRVDVDVAGTGTKGLIVTMAFQLP